MATARTVLIVNSPGDVPGSTARRMAALVLICFFLSGLTGLIYEILWTRMIVKIIAGAPFAVSIILTVFMAGLGLGSCWNKVLKVEPNNLSAHKSLSWATCQKPQSICVRRYE